MEYDNNYEYKANDLNASENKVLINELCNEYGFNLGSNRKRKIDIYDNAIKLKHFNNEQSCQ